MFICGGGSCSSNSSSHGKESSCITKPCISSKRTRTGRSSAAAGKIKNNPYADRGVEKFHALLAELHDKRQKIYALMGSENVSLIRFVSSDDSKRFKKIVVRVKDKEANKKLQEIKDNLSLLTKQYSGRNSARNHDDDAVPEKEESEEKYCWRCSTLRFRVASLVRMVVVVLVLLFLAIYSPFLCK